MDDIVFSSFMMKRGETRKNWRRRWMVLSSTGLVMYFKAKPDASVKKLPKPAGEIRVYQDCTRVKQVHECECEWPMQATANNSFGLETKSRTFYFTCDNDADCEDWLRYLSSCISKKQADDSSISHTSPTSPTDKALPHIPPATEPSSDYAEISHTVQPGRTIRYDSTGSDGAPTYDTVDPSGSNTPEDYQTVEPPRIDNALYSIPNKSPNKTVPNRSSNKDAPRATQPRVEKHYDNEDGDGDGILYENIDIGGSPKSFEGPCDDSRPPALAPKLTQPTPPPATPPKASRSIPTPVKTKETGRKPKQKSKEVSPNQQQQVKHKYVNVDIPIQTPVARIRKQDSRAE
eukprot:m.10015 g.10015  ORF g.10015 m.10015 type:complete len:346 (-) comp8064_c0_seq1:207-1244(-)